MTPESVSGEARQSIVDDEQLRLLALAHYISGALTILFASIFIFHFVFFVVIGSDPDFFPSPKAGHQGPPEALFQVLGAVLGTFILLGWAFGALTIYVGRCIARRVKRVLAIVVACLNLPFVPYGTILGVSALMVLTRSSVKRLFEGE